MLVRTEVIGDGKSDNAVAYRIVVEVIDLLSNDTTKTLTVQVK